MAWNAQGQWVPDEQQSVTQQTQQLSGLMATSQPAPDNVQTMAATSGPATTSAPTELNSNLLSGDWRSRLDAFRADREARRAARRGGGPSAPPANGGGSTTTPPPAPTPTTPPPPTQSGGLTTSPQSGTPPPAENASVADQLTGLLQSNNPYMQAAREAGMRVANRRGLLNSSIAAGASEASAIAAAAPIASQDAAQIHSRNQTNLEGWTQLRNASTLQHMSDSAAMARLLESNKNAITLSKLDNAAAMERLIEQGEIEATLQAEREKNALTQTQINANVSLLSNYMNAFAMLTQNPELPASARDAYMEEFIRTTSMGQSLVNVLAGTTVTWPTTGTPTTGTPTTGTSTTGGGGGGGGLLGGLSGSLQ